MEIGQDKNKPEETLKQILLKEVKGLGLRVRLILEIVIVFVVFAFIAPRFYYHELVKINLFPVVFVKMTIPEGFNIKQIAERFAKFKNFNKDNFLKITSSKEGYLFPDTYFFTGIENEYVVIKKMENAFETKALPILEKNKTNRSISDIIIMASILEEEARTVQEKKIVAGILWKRLDTKMPLQVDASLSYLNGKTSLEMTDGDLKKDSPYNTYTRQGLPIGPISNPGIESIKAAQEPEDSPFWYYLTDNKGNFYFAKTFEDHKLNKQKYLK